MRGGGVVAFGTSLIRHCGESVTRISSRTARPELWDWPLLSAIGVVNARLLHPGAHQANETSNCATFDLIQLDCCGRWWRVWEPLCQGQAYHRTRSSLRSHVNEIMEGGKNRAAAMLSDTFTSFIRREALIIQARRRPSSHEASYSFCTLCTFWSKRACIQLACSISLLRHGSRIYDAAKSNEV